MILAIDNGTSGGMAAISAQHGLMIAAAPIPVSTRTHTFKKTKWRKSKGQKFKETALAEDTEIDARRMIEWIAKVTESKPCPIAIEECPEHAQQKSTMRSMGISYGILIGAISASLPDYQLIVVRSGNPTDSWQRAMLGRLEQGDTKTAALAKARQLWPDENWLATARSTVPHSGMVDAALIAYHIRTILHPPQNSVSKPDLELPWT